MPQSHVFASDLRLPSHGSILISEMCIWPFHTVTGRPFSFPINWLTCIFSTTAGTASDIHDAPDGNDIKPTGGDTFTWMRCGWTFSRKTSLDRLFLRNYMIGCPAARWLSLSISFYECYYSKITQVLLEFIARTFWLRGMIPLTTRPESEQQVRKGYRSTMSHVSLQLLWQARML